MTVENSDQTCAMKPGVIAQMAAVARYRSVRYVIAAGWNTVFGYFLGVVLFISLSKIMHVAAIAAIGNVVSIAMSFVVYKLFVFQTKGNWFVEYLKCNLVYGANAAIGILLLWLLVDYGKVSIWIAQFLTIMVTAVMSYIGNRIFTFKRL